MNKRRRRIARARRKARNQGLVPHADDMARAWLRRGVFRLGLATESMIAAGWTAAPDGQLIPPHGKAS